MDRPIKPYAEVHALLGNAASAFEQLAGHIRYTYVLDELWEEGNPNHKHYNNLRFRRGGKTLITLCLREGCFIACVVLGKDEREKFDVQRERFSAEVCKAYDEAETYHDGKWLGFELYDASLVDDIIHMLLLKRKPNRKIFPEHMEQCGKLDIGLSHEEITERIMH